MDKTTIQYGVKLVLLSLTYLSSATVHVDQDLLDQVLKVSRRNNTRTGLTGMLLHADGHFIQTLEGEAEAVDRAYRRILADPRHRNALVALREPIEARAFGEWSMGFRHLSAEEAALTPGLNDYFDPDSERYRDNRLLGRAGIFHRIFRDDTRLHRAG